MRQTFDVQVGQTAQLGGRLSLLILPSLSALCPTEQRMARGCRPRATNARHSIC